MQENPALCISCRERPYTDGVTLRCHQCSSQLPPAKRIRTTAPPPRAPGSISSAPRSVPSNRNIVPAEPRLVARMIRRVDLSADEVFHAMLSFARTRRSYRDGAMEIYFHDQRLAILQTPRDFDTPNFPYAFAIINGEIDHTKISYEAIGRALAIYKPNVIKLIAKAALQALRGRPINEAIAAFPKDAIDFVRLEKIRPGHVYSALQLLALLIGAAICEGARGGQGNGYLNIFSTLHRIKHADDETLQDELINDIFPSNYNERYDALRHATGFSGSQRIIAEWPKLPTSSYPKLNQDFKVWHPRYIKMTERDQDHFRNWPSKNPDETAKQKLLRKVYRHWEHGVLGGYVPKRGRIVHDGHCLFRSIAEQLWGNTSDDAVEAIRTKLHRFYTSDEGVGVRNVLEIDDRRLADLTRMNDNIVWGGNEEIETLSLIYNRRIVVHYRDGISTVFSGLSNTMGDEHALPNPDPNDLHLYFDDSHFDVVPFWE